DAQLGSVRDAGYSDGEIVEIIASVVLSCFTNFLNNAADTQLDIPQAEALSDISPKSCSTSACAT
ncbi:hypothetical protein ACFL2H_12115, partial [Planctomycetota bacterium]